jgi:hypothetical protein
MIDLNPKIDSENQKRDVEIYLTKDVKDITSLKEYNDRVINASIKKYEAKRAKKQKDYQEQVAMRVEAAMDFVFWQEHGGNNGRRPQDYFSKQQLAELQGRKILEKATLFKKLRSLDDISNY